MKKSLQDQLIKAGLGNKQQARQINTAKKKNKSKSEASGPTDAQKKQAAQAEKDRERNLEIQAAAQAKAALAQAKQLIESNALPTAPRGLPYYFVDNGRVHRFKVDEPTRIRLAFGQAGIVSLPKPVPANPIDGEERDTHNYHIVPEGTLDKLVKRGAQDHILWRQTSSSLKDFLERNEMDDWSYPKGVFD